MGAVQWSPEELDYFRNELLPISQYSKSYLDKYNGGMAFEELWPVIQYELRDIHNPPRRTYTSQILFQHYYQGLKRRGISRNKKGPSVRLTPTKLARVRKLREQLRDGFFGDVPASAKVLDQDGPDTVDASRQGTPTPTGPSGHRRSRYAPMRSRRENENPFPEFPLVPPVEHNMFTLIRDRHRASQRDTNEPQRGSPNMRFSDDDFEEDEPQSPSNYRSKPQRKKKSSRTPTAKPTSTKKSAARKPAENDMDPRAANSGNLSPVGVERFDIKYESTRPLRHPVQMMAGAGAKSKPWIVFGDDDEDEMILDDDTEDNRPDFGEFDW